MDKKFAEIISFIKQTRNKVLQIVNTELINLYWNVGAYISGQVVRAAWGDGTIDDLADLIKKEHPDLKGFNRSGLFRMRRFYETYANSKFVSTVLTQIVIGSGELQPQNR